MSTDKTLLAIAARLLDYAADAFSNHGCNDYTLPVTPDHIAFLKEMIADGDYPEDEPHIYGGELFTRDDMLMRYCADRLRAEATIDAQ